MMPLALVTALACGNKEESKGEQPDPSAGAAEQAGKAADPDAVDDPTAGDPAAAEDPAAGDPEAGDPAAGELPPEAAEAGEVPTEEDFEDKAEKDIGESNLEAEVKKLEEELGVKPK